MSMEDDFEAMKAAHASWVAHDPRIGANSSDLPRTNFRDIECAATFCRRWQPPAYIVDGVLARGRVQALIAYTGHTKTTTAMHLALCVATGQPFGSHETEQGAVLILAGENPDLVVGQFRAACLAANVEPERVPVHFHYGRFSITEHGEALKREAGKIARLALIIPDTHQAFFEGDNDNDNIQALAAAQKWRPFAELPTRPTVLIPCHPSGKKPDRDNLVPRGGSAFMNEIDGNFCLWKRDDIVAMHWQGKHRGPSFEPIDLKLVMATHPEIVDGKGREIAMPVIRPLMELERIDAETNALKSQLRALVAIRGNPKLSVRGLADEIKVGKSRAGQIIQQLIEERLIQKRAKRLEITKDGQDVLADEGLGS